MFGTARSSTASAGIIMIVFRQPGANIIETVDGIKALLPELRAVIPPTVNFTVVSDRTETIRASVQNIQFTLLLTVAPGHHGHFHISAQRLGDRDPEHFRAAFAGGHIRSHVFAWVQHRQSLVDGAGDRDGVRGR